MKRLLREPLLHFLVLGAALFLLLRAPSEAPASRRIVVTPRDVEHLIATFTQTWRRPPAPAEVQALIQDHVREEVFYREGLALELDVNDVLVRQLMRKKMEALAEDAALRTPPTDAELRAYYDAHADVFRPQPRMTLHQVFLDPEKRGDTVQPDAAALLRQLQQTNVDPSTLGDPSLLAQHYPNLSGRDVARIFGEAFAAEVERAALGTWSGPFTSHLGVHLVRVDDRRQADVRPFEEAREAVAREVARTRRKAAVEELYRTLLQRYDVDVQVDGAAAVPQDAS